MIKLESVEQPLLVIASEAKQSQTVYGITELVPSVSEEFPSEFASSLMLLAMTVELLNNLLFSTLAKYQTVPEP